MTREGASFDGYRLVRLLGSGGAGEVYLAESPAGGPVALKIYRQAGGQPAAHEMMRQAQIAAALDHPHILQCYGDVQQDDDLGIVMEYASDGSLGDLLGMAGGQPGVDLPMRPASVARIVSQVAHTLTDVQEHGLAAHGDLKPDNLFVRTAPEGSPIVAVSDFGHGFQTRSAVSLLRQRVGQPPKWVVEQLTWAAPEQLLGRPSPASDQYSLAAIAYCLLTGERPISAEAQNIVYGRVAQAILPPSRLNPVLDDAVDAALLQALSPVPEQRFSDVVDFADVLDAALTAGSAPSAGSSRVRRARSLRGGQSIIAQGKPSRGFPGPLTLPTTVHGRVVRASASVVDDISGAVGDFDEGGVRSEPRQDSPESAGGLRRRVGRFMAVATLLALVALTVSALFFNAGPLRLPVHLDMARLVGGGGASIAQSSPTPVSSAQTQAEARLRAALATRPTYSDALSGTPASWPVSGTAVFFGADHRLHLHNAAKTPLLADMPASAALPQGAYVAQVDVSLVSGHPGDHAGIRFLSSKSDQGASYYLYLVTADSHFAVWEQQPTTGLVFVTSGYVPSLKTGAGQVNTLSVLIDPTASTLTLFANGTFVYQSPVSHGVPLTGRLGLVASESGVEAAFANFALYNG